MRKLSTMKIRNTDQNAISYNIMYKIALKIIGYVVRVSMHTTSSHSFSFHFLFWSELWKALIGQIGYVPLWINWKNTWHCRNSTTTFSCTWRGKQLQASNHSLNKHLQIFLLPSAEYHDLRKKLYLHHKLEN